MPHSDDGTRIEPLVSEPSVSGTWPAATAAAEPPDEPPAMRARSCGLRVGAVVRVLGGEAVGVLVHVERADQHRAGRLEAAHEQRVALRGRGVALDLRAGQRRQAGDVEQVLDREGHAGQRHCARVAGGGRTAFGALRSARSPSTTVKALTRPSVAAMRSRLCSTAARGRVGARAHAVGQRRGVERPERGAPSCRRAPARHGRKTCRIRRRGRARGRRPGAPCRRASAK